MKKTIQIPEGNEFSLFIPFVVFSKSGREDASAALWNDLQVVVHMSNSTANVDCTYSVQAQYVVVSFGNDLKRSSYDVIISGEYERRKVCAPLNNHFAITAWADGNYADFIVGQPIICPTQTIIGQFNTTQDIIDLTEELRSALAVTEAAKEEYEEKVEELENVAQQGTNPDATNTAILTAIGNISIDTTTIAKQGNNPNTDLSQVASDVTDLGTALNQAAVILAKQGNNVEATLSDTQTAAQNAAAAVKDGNDTAVSVGKDVRSEVGSGSDTAAETGTLFAVVKWVKDKVKSIFNLIGSPVSGQPATLFAAIAAGGGGGGGDAQESTSQAILAEIGSAGSGQSSTLFGAIGDVALSATTLQSLANSWAAEVTNRNSLNGIVCTREVSGFADVLANPSIVSEIHDTNATIAQDSAFVQYTNLAVLELGMVSIPLNSNIFIGIHSGCNLTLPNLTTLGGSGLRSMSNGTTNFGILHLPNVTSVDVNIVYNSTYPTEVYMDNLPQIATNYAIRQCVNLRKVYVPKLSRIDVGENFNGCTSLIDITIGAYMTGSFSLSKWSPTTALLSDSTSLVDEGETFSSNLEKLLYNIREHIAANLSGDITATITFSSAVKAAIQADSATLNSFPASWTIA